MWKEFCIYTGRIRLFGPSDWQYYTKWIGLILGLFCSITGFLVTGVMHGVEYPSYVWNMPVGSFIFLCAIAVDTIGHQTIYREALESGERLVHAITIYAGIASCVLLTLSYSVSACMIPAIVLAGISFFYSVIDEWMHWMRYMHGQSDRIEMWSHFFIFVGHLILMVTWFHWAFSGYPGVAATLH